MRLAHHLSTLALTLCLLPSCGGDTSGAGTAIRANSPADAGADANAKPDGDHTADAAQTGDSGDASEHCGKGPVSTPPGRPVPHVCSETASVPAPDAGGAACGTDADCPTFLHCWHGICRHDACLVDDDCTAGEACVCAGEFYGGNGGHGNICVQAQCRVDADCGPASVCGISSTSTCGWPTGIFCHSPADECGTHADCCEAAPKCVFEPTLGRWACEAIAACGG